MFHSTLRARRRSASPQRACSPSRSPRLTLALAASLGLALSASCANQDDTCQDTRTYFSEQVWGPVMSSQCVSCHGPGGRAQAEGAKFKLMPGSYPGFLDVNLDNIREVARLEAGGVSSLLLKPLGELAHGGGAVLRKGTRDYDALVQLVSRLKSNKTCAPSTASAFAELVLLDPQATLRKATLGLLGRLPKPEELAQVAAGGEAALGTVLSALLEDEAFLERVKEIYNDTLLTDRYMTYNGRAIGLLDDDDFPGRGSAYYEGLSNDEKWWATVAVAREPLELIAHVIRKNKPFTEILTANYTVVNAYSAKVYGAQGLTFDARYPYTDFQEAKLTVPREGAPVALPHAGVLTTPVFLNRFPTTPTNRNRHRARMILDIFLATDILRVADRPIDPTAATRFPNPTREDPACSTCHRILDPIAGAFQKFNESDQDRFDLKYRWFDEMYAPGFGGEVMQTSDLAQGPQWLAQRIAQDPRFVQATINTMYRGLVGGETAEYPTDAAAPDYKQKLRAWEAQDKVFQSIGEAFVASRYNFKVLVRDLLLSPYFRAVTTRAALAPARATELERVGPGRLLTPELLSRKLDALFGVSWIRGWDSEPYLLQEFRVLYGGIDSDGVTKRLGVPGGVMAGVAARMANEMACKVTAFDFTKAPATRTLFPHVTLQHVPEAETGDPIPGSIASIRKNLQHLHKHLLGEDLGDGDAELERTYRLFLETWREGKRNLVTRVESNDLPWNCQATEDPKTGVDLPMAQRIGNDANYVVRSWMAVLTYLLMDYRFLHE